LHPYTPWGLDLNELRRMDKAKQVELAHQSGGMGQGLKIVHVSA